MDTFVLFAKPWWVNLLVLIPIISYYLWRRTGLSLAKQQLIGAALFGAAFGFVEAAVVVYLRAATGLLPGYQGTLSDVQRLASGIYQQAQILGELPKSLLAVELLRETATMVMLIAVAILAARTRKERLAVFLWTFAAWDICYYAGLWVTVRWPSSLLTPDVLFLIPEPWFSQVWFPLLVSALTVAAVLLTRKSVFNPPSS